MVFFAETGPAKMRHCDIILCKVLKVGTQATARSFLGEGEWVVWLIAQGLKREDQILACKPNIQVLNHLSVAANGRAITLDKIKE